MKIVFASDFHLDWRTHGIDRFADLEKAVMQTVDMAYEQEAAAYIFGGDLCDPDSGSRTFRCVELAIRVAMILQDAKIPSLWVAGNHDVIEDGSGQTTLTPLRAFDGFDEQLVYVAEEPGVFDLGNGVPPILALPFAATSHTYDPAVVLRNWKQLLGKPLVTVSHLSVLGIAPGEETTEMPRGRDIVFPIEELQGVKNVTCLQGHYHRQQTFNPGEGYPLIHVAGSLVRLTFNEEGNSPGFLIVEV